MQARAAVLSEQDEGGPMANPKAATADGTERAGGIAAVQPVSSTTRRDGVLVEIKRAIVLGSLRPGQKLTESGLSSSLQVSRPTVREALNQLAQEGLVVQEAYRGLRVAHHDAKAIIDIAEARVAIDLQAVATILADISGRRLQMVVDGWREFERSAFDPDPFMQHAAHLKFHHSILAASENYLLIRMWPVIEAHITIALAQDQFARLDPDRAYAVHKQLVEAIQTRDPETIRAAFVGHTIDSAKELVAMMEAGDTAV